MRYSFFEEKAKIEKNPDYTLPDDINQPIIDWLEKIGCAFGANEVKIAQQNVAYRKFEIVNRTINNATITLQMQCGMITERKEVQQKSEGNWVVSVTKTVKNPKISKYRPRKEK